MAGYKVVKTFERGNKTFDVIQWEGESYYKLSMRNPHGSDYVYSEDFKSHHEAELHADEEVKRLRHLFF